MTQYWNWTRRQVIFEVGAIKWTELTTIGIASLALLVSLSSFVVAYRAFGLAKAQEQRRKPLFNAYLIDGYVQYSTIGDARVYAFLLSVTNPTDSNNSIAKAHLQIAILGRPTVQVPLTTTKGDAFAKLADFTPLQVPARVDAHQAIAGWSLFRVPETILSGAAVERYTVVLVDSHALETMIEPIMVREYVDEPVRST